MSILQNINSAKPKMKAGRRNKRFTPIELLIAGLILVVFSALWYQHYASVKITGQLLLAVQRNDLPRIRKLIEQGADVNGQSGQSDPSGIGGGFWGGGYETPTPPLSVSIVNGNVPMRSLLLNHGANVNQTDGQHMTPLMYAAGGGQTTLCLALIKRGAQILDTDFQNRDALAWAAVEGKLETVKSLLATITDRKEHQIRLDRALLQTASGGADKEAMTSELLTLGANPNAIEDGYGNDGSAPSCLIYSIRANNLRSSETLLKHGADPNKLTMRNVPLVGVANAEMIDLLLKYHVDMNKRDNNGLGPVALALMGNNGAMAIHMLHRGADPNMIDNEGNTLIMLAAQFQRPQVVDRLIKYGADLNATNKQGMTALKLAGPGTVIATMLIKAGAK